MSTTATATSRRKQKPSILSGGKVWFISAAAIAALVVIGVFLILSKLTATTTYYVLNQDVQARTQITASMLTPVTTSEGGQPRNALTIGYVQQNYTAAKYGLSAGDVITPSNAGSLTPLTQGIPDNFVVASFSAPVETSVAGKIKRGDYVDLIATEGESGATSVSKYFLRHVLIVDASAAPNPDAAANASSAAVDANGQPVSGGETAVTRSIPTLYTVALSPEDAAKLAFVSANNSSLMVVLSAANFAPDADISANRDQVYQGTVGDSGANTDSSFGEDKTATSGN